MRKYSFTSPSFQLFINSFRYQEKGIAEGIFELFGKEQLSAQFFDDYLKHKEELAKILKNRHTNIDLEIVKEYSEELFDRLIFIKFLDTQNFFKKYGYGERFLYNSFRAAWQDNFYANTLEPLFKSLNTPKNRRVSQKFKDLPYLNGGLFEELELEKLLKKQLKIPNEFFANIFYISEDKPGFFEKYQWVTEDSIEEGIDPEILGYIFEQSIQQKCFGAFYTNTNIATFMARESVVNFLYKNCEHNFKTQEEFANWIFEEKIHENEPLVTKIAKILKKIKILDLVVGSGSLLLAVLKEIIKIFSCLNILKTSNEYYKEILSLMSNIYGIDIHSKAIEKCKLRLWLFLGGYLVNNEEYDLPALPNIDFRIFCGNSLIGYTSSPDADLDHYFSEQEYKNLLQWDKEYFLPENPEIAQVSHDNIAALLEKGSLDFHDQYFNTHFTGFKHLFSEEILKGLEKLRKRKKYKPPGLSSEDWNQLSIYMESKSWKTTSKRLLNTNDDKILLQALNFSTWKELFLSIKPFHWFIQVFPFLKREKFDIIIANPPYLAYEALKSFEPDLLDCYLQKKFNQVFIENTKIYTWQQYRYDLLLPFLERTLHLANDNGVICMILADSFCRNKYALKFRKFLLENTSLTSLVHFNKKLSLFKKFEGGTLKPVGVDNFIVIFNPIKDKKENFPRRYIFQDYSLISLKMSPVLNQQELTDHSVFRFDQEFFDVAGIPLRLICYLTIGLMLQSHGKKPEYKGLFGKNDLISTKKDENHPFKYIENKYLTHLSIYTHKYLEWGTERVPEMIEYHIQYI